MLSADNATSSARMGRAHPPAAGCRWLGPFVVIVVLLFANQGFSISTMGPLHVHPTNPRYFADGSGAAVYLTGSHTWASLQDLDVNDPPEPFDFAGYLDFLEQHGHNFIRLWRTEAARLQWGENIRYSAPHPWQRTGPGQALDDKLRFDLERFDEAFFTRLRGRVMAAGARGIYVSIMLFEGWGLYYASFDGHPCHRLNNVQGLDGDPDGDGRGLETQMLRIPGITAVQEAYARKVIDTVNDLDNVLYEITNESRLLEPAANTTDWQYHMIRVIQQYQATKPNQHPVGMTSQGYGGGDDSHVLLASPADWISPNPDKFDYRNDPPANDGGKVILLDTDHLWGIGGGRSWVWQSFLRGLHPIWMDPYDRADKPWGPKLPPEGEQARRAMGYTRTFAERINLAALSPQVEVASSGYCLVAPGQEYLVYLPQGPQVTVDLAGTAEFIVEWFDPETGASQSGPRVPGGGARLFHSPFEHDAVLYLQAADGY